MGRNATSLTSSAGRPLTGPDFGREAGDAGSSSWHSHDEGGHVRPAVPATSLMNRSLVRDSGPAARGAQQPAGQTRLEQQLLTAFRARLVAVWAAASRPNDKLTTTAANAIKANRKSKSRRVIGRSWPGSLIFHSSIIIR